MSINIKNHSPISLFTLETGEIVVIDKWGTVWDKEAFLNECRDCMVSEMVNRMIEQRIAAASGN